MTNKGLISNIHKKLILPNIKNKLNLKMYRRKQTFFQRGNVDCQQIGTWKNVHHQKPSEKCKSNIQWDYYLIPIRMAIINKNTNNKYWRICGEKRTLIHSWWECKPVQPVWKTVGRFLKKLKTELPFDPAILLLGIYLPKKVKKIRILIQKDIQTQCSKQHYLQLPIYGSNPSVHQQTIWYINTMEYYLAIKKNEVLQQFGYTWRVLYWVK